MNNVQMTRLSGGLGVLALAVLISAGHALSALKPYYTPLFGIGVALVVALFAFTYWSERTFDELFNTRDKAWPRALFTLLCLAEVTLFAGGPIKTAAPGAVIAILLTWYGSTFIFGTFFFGKAVALFFYSPVSWLAYLVRKKSA